MTLNEIRKKSAADFRRTCGNSAAVYITAAMIEFALFAVILTFQLVSFKLFGKACFTGAQSAVFYAAYVLTVVFVFMPLSAGKQVYVTKVAAGETPPVDTLFCFFKKGYGKALGVKLRKALVGLCIALLIVIAAASVYTFNISIIYIAAAAVIAAITAAVCVSLRYSAMYITLNSDFSVGINAIMRKSVRRARKNKMRVLGLVLSMTGWILLGLITCGIAFIWVLPYISIAVKNYYLAA